MSEHPTPGNCGIIDGHEVKYYCHTDLYCSEDNECIDSDNSSNQAEFNYDKYDAKYTDCENGDIHSDV